MSQASVNIRVDETLKHDMENLCQQLGMSLTTAITIFFKRAVLEQGIPFKVSADPFYAESNQARIREAIARLNAGHGTEHELIEADE